MGEDDVCTGDLVGVARRKRIILSFGEDEDGELYVVTVRTTLNRYPSGVIYKLVDPARLVPLTKWMYSNKKSAWTP